MNKIKQCLSRAFYDEGIFRYIYLMTLFLCSVCFVDQISEVIKGFVLVWGAFIIKNAFWANKNIINVTKIRYWGILLLFLAAGMVTAVLHIQNNFGANLIMLYHTLVCFTVFYGIHTQPNRQKVRQEMQLVLKTFVVLSTVFSVAGLLIALLYARIYVWGYCLGLIDNRFTGVYINPNLAAFASAIGIICSHFLYLQRPAGSAERRILPVWFIWLSFVSNVFALLLTDSNASLVFLLMYALLFLLYKVMQQNSKEPASVLVKKGIAVLLVCLVTSCGAFGIRNIFQNGVAAVTNLIQPDVQNEETISTVAYRTTNDTAVHAAIGSSVVIGRTDYELSSGRLTSLRQAMVLFVKNPVMGVGKANILTYGKRYISGGFAYTDLHNGYLTILISSGIIGLIIFMLFLGMLANRMLKCMVKRIDKKRQDFPVLLCAVGAYSVFALFEKAMLFDITFMVVAFWMLLGYATYYLVQYETKDEKQHTANEYIPSLQSIPSPAYFADSHRFTGSIALNTAEPIKKEALSKQ